MNKSDFFWQTYLNLENELLDLAKYIYITDQKNKYKGNKLIIENCTTQLETFSPHIADLIVRTCVEIEAISKELYFELGGTKTRGDKDLFFDEDCLKQIDFKCNSSKKIVMITCPYFNLNDDSNKIFKPLREAHKRQGTSWERAYQAVKHDRYSSVSFGTVKNYIHALGALYLLNIYYKNQKINVKHSELSKLDFSFGSKVFSLTKPSEKYITDVINGIAISGNLFSDESPYIFKFTNSEYHNVLNLFNEETEKRNKFIFSQPEIQDTEFFKQISKDGIFIPELFKYRLNKKIPKTLTFEERKKLFIESKEFNGRIRLQSTHKNADELTEQNIQQEIDSAGINAGLEIELQFQNPKIQKGLINGNCELVIDKGNVKYQ